MNKLSERRLAENEIVFRDRNKAVQEFVDADDKHDGSPLDFYCECSAVDCKQRIRLPADEYEELHKNRKQFIAVNGHELSAIERIVEKKDGFNVIEKFKLPEESSD